MEKVLSSKTRVRFQDCDPYNHLNNAKYIDYMINAREDQVLEHYNLDVFAMATDQGKAWVVASNQIAYFNPAFTMEQVWVDSQLIYSASKSIQVEIRMLNFERTQLKAFMWVSFVHYDLVQKSVIQHSESLMQLFGQILSPLEEKVFEERFRKLKTGATL